MDDNCFPLSSKNWNITLMFSDGSDFKVSPGLWPLQNHTHVLSLGYENFKAV